MRTLSLRRHRAAVITAAVLAMLVPAAPSLAARPTAPAAPSLEQQVTDAMVTRVGKSPDALAAAGRDTTVTVQRRDRQWAFGTAVLTAPVGGDEFPHGWLFLAERGDTGWTVTLDNSAGFAELAQHAPASVLSDTEKATFRASWQAATTLAPSSNNTGLRLPWSTGQTWSLGGGPHGWSGYDTPYSSVDLNGGDYKVRAAGSGTVYTMCTSTQGGVPGGWRRVYHSNGYTTDYYHMWYLTSLTDGSSIAAGTQLGQTGTNLCAGGSASGRHVHWGILSGSTRVAWHWKSAGKWVFWEGSAYNGYALHGSTVVYPGGGLYNYGSLGSNQGIIDTWGGGYVNKRSGPGTGYSIVGSVSDGTTVTVSCWSYGTSHTGRWGTTSVWNKLTDGTWVSDAFMYTGVNTLGGSC